MKRILLVLSVACFLAFCAAITAAALRAQEQSPEASSADIAHRVEAYLREYYAWGPEFQVKVAPPSASPIPGVYQVSIEVAFQGQTSSGIVYVSHDGHYMIRGSLDNLLADPFASNRDHLHLENHPSVGPSNACVNVVEFSDFQCTHCREIYGFLKQLESRHPQVHFVFADFPVVQIHNWAMTAALAARCAYAQNPADYLKLQQAIFDNQDQITADNASEKLLSLASQAGLDTAGLRNCIISPDTRKMVDADIALGRELNINSTPSLFVNGHPLVSSNDQMLDRLLTYELTRCSLSH
jgi:protein-disulfide isomerase